MEMISLFLGLSLANLICLLAATVLGYVTAGNGAMGQWHMLAGAMAAVMCVAVHCVVFTYFIATAKWIQHAAALKRLDPGLIAPTRSFKAQAFPAALAAMGCVFVTAVLGAIVDNYGISAAWHHATALGTIMVNLAAACVEFSAIRRNGSLVDRILEMVNASESALGEPRPVSSTPTGHLI
jgi:NhaP-type Na+/H+ and K+/H+ antiporter